MVISVNIVLVGSNVASMLLAHRLSTEHNVIIVEQEAEVGMPVRHPGLVHDLELLSEFIPTRHQHVLQLQHNPSIDAFGCRWEWVCKLLVIELTRRGVNVRTRARIVDSTTTDDDVVCLHLVTSLGDDVLYVDRVVDMRYGVNGPGSTQHMLDTDHIVSWSRPTMAKAHGMVVLKEESANAPSATLIVHRKDGTSEVWWQQTPSWTPLHGALERMNGQLPKDASLWSFDGAQQFACIAYNAVAFDRI